MSQEIVNALLEDGEIPDPKYFSDRVPTVYDEAIQSAVANFQAACDSGRVTDAKSADEVASEIAQDACAEFGLNDNDDFDEVVSHVFKLSAELFPGEW